MSFVALSHLQLEDELQRRQSKIEQVESRCKQLLQENKLLGAVIEELKSSKIELSNQLQLIENDSKRGLEAVESRLCRQVTELESSRREVLREKKHMEDEISSLRSELASLRAQNENLNRKLEQEQNERDAAFFLDRGRVAEFEAEKAELMRSKNEMESLALDLSDEIQTLKKRLEEAQAHVVEAKPVIQEKSPPPEECQECGSLRAQLQSVQASLKKAAEAEVAARTAVNDTAHTLFVLSKSESILRAKLAAASETIEQVTRQLRDEGEHTAQLQKEKVAASDENQKLLKRVQVLEFQAAQLRLEIRRLQEQLIESQTSSRADLLQRALQAAQATQEATPGSDSKGRTSSSSLANGMILLELQHEKDALAEARGRLAEVQRHANSVERALAEARQGRVNASKQLGSETRRVAAVEDMRLKDMARIEELERCKAELEQEVSLLSALLASKSSEHIQKVSSRWRT